MLNKEKYVKEIVELSIMGVDIALKDNKPVPCCSLDCKECNRNDGTGGCSLDELFEWANSEYKEPILTEEEKAYLSAVIKPFRDKVKCILKCSNSGEWIAIKIIDDATINFPYFEKGSMYKGMKLDRKYTLEELGL